MTSTMLLLRELVWFPLFLARVVAINNPAAATVHVPRWPVPLTLA